MPTFLPKINLMSGKCDPCLFFLSVYIGKYIKIDLSQLDYPMKIAVLVSGGVDSSVALRLLQQQGHEVRAFYLKIWLEDELAYLGDCPWEEDLAYVRAVCEQAGVPFEVVSLQKEYWEQVVNYTIAEIKAGRTPNPDILCNQRIKFNAFLNKIADDFDYVASGHYAQVYHSNGYPVLSLSPDSIKDQTYFLSHLSQAQLRKVLFPIGHLSKAEVRAYATAFDLPNKDRKDSQGICFLGKLKFSEFIRHHLGDLPGNLVEFETGTIVGQHKGFWYYTRGQRQGIGLSGGPWYVVDKDIQKNIVYISRNYYDDGKERKHFTISDCNWINQPPQEGILYRIKVRHGPEFHEGIINSIDNGRYHIILNERDQALAPGQFAVVYDDKQCLGGGVIE